MPLKGMLLKKLYPHPWLREMSDIDVWYDASATDKVREIMLADGFREKTKYLPNHEVYIKGEIYTVETHTDLFKNYIHPDFHAYFHGKTYAPCQDSPYKKQMTPNEQYIYLTAHAFVHYSSAGTGLRTLLDQRIFLKRFGGELDIKRHPYYSHHPTVQDDQKAQTDSKRIKVAEKHKTEQYGFLNAKENGTALTRERFRCYIILLLCNDFSYRIRDVVLSNVHLDSSRVRNIQIAALVGLRCVKVDSLYLLQLSQMTLDCGNIVDVDLTVAVSVAELHAVEEDVVNVVVLGVGISIGTIPYTEGEVRVVSKSRLRYACNTLWNLYIFQSSAISKRPLFT